MRLEIGGRLLRFAVAVLAALLVTAATGAAAADSGSASDAGGAYLALGDSVAFGYVPPQAVPAPNYYDAHSFVGYPEYLAQQLGEHVWNASCPGETSASMLTAGAQSNGCENSVGSSTGYRTLYPLHVQYQGTQLGYALQFLETHQRTRLVTIDIGANDAFVCEETTSDGCTSAGELAALAGRIAANLGAIFLQLRATGYHGPIVSLTYYSLSYSDPAEVAATEFLDAVIAGVTKASGGIVADGFSAFAAASASSAGDPCAAGLLIKLPDGSCNIHPSAKGQQLLAAAIASAAE